MPSFSGGSLFLVIASIIIIRSLHPSSAGIGKRFITPKFKLINEPATTWCFGEEFETLGGTAKTLDTINGEVPICDGVCQFR